MAETTELSSTSLKEELMYKVNKMGISLNDSIYKICIADILEVAADNLEDEILSYTKSEIERLIRKGTKGCETILWYEKIESALFF